MFVSCFGHRCWYQKEKNIKGKKCKTKSSHEDVKGQWYSHDVLTCWYLKVNARNKMEDLGQWISSIQDPITLYERWEIILLRCGCTLKYLFILQSKKEASIPNTTVNRVQKGTEDLQLCADREPASRYSEKCTAERQKKSCPFTSESSLQRNAGRAYVSLQHPVSIPLKQEPCRPLHKTRRSQTRQWRSRWDATKREEQS